MVFNIPHERPFLYIVNELKISLARGTSLSRWHKRGLAMGRSGYCTAEYHFNHVFACTIHNQVITTVNIYSAPIIQFCEQASYGNYNKYYGNTYKGQFRMAHCFNEARKGA